MTKGFRIPALFFGAGLLFPATPSFASPDGPGKAILVYLENDPGSAAALKKRFAFFNQVSFDTLSVDDHGVVSGKNPRQLLAFAQSKNMATYAAISNFAGNDFSGPIAHSILHSAEATNAFIAGMIDQLNRGHYTGINVDFEAIPPEDRDAYTAFIKIVSEKMHAAGYQVVLSVPAEAKDDPADSWSGAFDFPALGRLVDTLQLMTYDENGTWSKPGPVAGFAWVESAVKYAVSVVPAGKISLGIPAYGYDWDLKDKSDNKQVPWTALPALLAQAKDGEQWDAADSSPHFRYSVDDHRHVVWYENAKSLAPKIALVATYNLAGVSVYALGMEDDSFWQAIHNGGF
jgi:spore germination protein YaaH